MVLSRSKDKLHWVEMGKSSDWQGIPTSKLNHWQKIASATSGFITPGNILSVFGFCLVAVGLYNFSNTDSQIGLLQVIVGRFMDYADGTVAHNTRTKSAFGALLDASLDTLAFVLALVVLIDMQVLPIALAIGITVPKTCNAIGYSAAKLRHKRLNTTGQSKIATALLWLSVIIFMASHLIGGLFLNWLPSAGWVLMVSAILLTIPASIEYMLVGLGNKQQEVL